MPTPQPASRMIEVSEALIRATFNPNVFAAGQAYMRTGRVKAVATEPATGNLRATVSGSGGARYKLEISVAEQNGRAIISGQCSCPVAHNCKHVAAVLLAQRQKGGVPLSAASAPTASHAHPALPPPLADWLQGLAVIEDPNAAIHPPNTAKRLFYLLSPLVLHGHAAPELHVAIALGDIRQDGTINPRHATPDPEELSRTEPPPPYLLRSDRTILHHLDGYCLDEHRSDTAAVLHDILATGRARLGGFPGTAARLGNSRAGTLDWKVDDQGSQRPMLDVQGGGVPVLVPTPWYLDAGTGEVGPVDIALAPAMLRRLLTAPPVPPEQAAALAEALRATLPRAGLPMPRDVPHGGPIGGVPTPHLRLVPLALDYSDRAGQVGHAALIVSFAYGELLIPHHTPPGAAERVLKGVRYSLLRDDAAERRALAKLKKFGFVELGKVMRWGAPAQHTHSLVLPHDPDGNWLDFLIDTMPKLQALGWDIAAAPDFPHRVITPDAPMQAELRESGGMDWFDLDLGVLVGGERVDLVPPLLRLLERPDAAAIIAGLQQPARGPGRKLVLALDDGRRLALDVASVRGVLTTLFDLFNAGGLAARGNGVGLSRHGAAGVAALERAGLAAGLVWRGGEALRALGRMLHERGGITHAAIPDSFAAALRPYQQQGVDWLQFLRQAGLAGVLADDMGLGKTVQTLAHLCIEKQAGRLTSPALVICPTSVVGNWAREAARFAPALRVLPLQGVDRKASFSEIDCADLVISTYPLLARDDEVLLAREWHALILDEAQTIKNPAATMAQTVRRLRAQQRICLTGTPMENHLGELWALFDFMMPGFLGSAQDFGRRFRTPIEKDGDGERHAALARRVSPFLLRRTKADVLDDLPPRTDILETIQMQPPQRAVYDGIRLAMHERVQAAIAENGLAKSGIVILDALLKLRQACCDPRLLKMAGASAKKAGSAKLERLLEMLTTMLDEGRTILLFSQFTSMLALIEEELKSRGISYVLLTGRTVDRATPVAQFQAGHVKLFLVSLKAGGVGLNLTAADTVIHYDPWWNPAVENQATDRAHRIGQTKAVFVHRLTVENTIEEKMEVLKERKSALAEGILSGAGASALKMTEADVEVLFS